MSSLTAELIGYLDGGSARGARRTRAEALLEDLLVPMPTARIGVRLPASPPARRIASELMDRPDEDLTLAQWGRRVGAGERTLARAFLRETGLPFGRWRTQMRLQAALLRLAGGSKVSSVAGKVGYDTPSAFVAAFRRETGSTPADYFRGLPRNGKSDPGR